MAAQLTAAPENELPMKGFVKLGCEKLPSRSSELSVLTGHVPVVPDKSIGLSLPRILEAVIKLAPQARSIGKKSINRQKASLFHGEGQYHRETRVSSLRDRLSRIFTKSRQFVVQAF